MKTVEAEHGLNDTRILALIPVQYMLKKKKT